MSRVAVHLTVDPEVGQPISIGRLEDSAFVRAAAHLLIMETRAKAARIGEHDELMGRLRREEARRLEVYLRKLVPALEPARG